MINPRALPVDLTQAVRSQMESSLEGLRSSRLSFWAHWAALAEMFCPRRYKWFVTPNQLNRGSQINQSIVDETGVIAARVLSSGMMSGLTSPTRQWFKLSLHDLSPIDYGPVKTWLAECERRMLRVLSESNFYQSLGVLYHDNGIFGSAAMIIYEDADEIIRCYNPCLGEFFFKASSRLDINGLYREFTLTVEQAVEQFGLPNLSVSTQQAYKTGGGSRTNEIVIAHGIEPNTMMYEGEHPIAYAVPKKFPYREVYWERSQSGQYLISLAGYNEKPFIGARWDTVSNDAYGRSPGMDAMPATRQIQIQQRRKAEAIDKLVRPPMNASIQMKNEPASILPGAVNYVSDINTAGFKPAFTVEPRIAEMVEDIKEVCARINSVFFVDLFMMISQLDTVRTATEISARKEEKLVQLGPVIERFENEVLDPIIERVFAIMLRRGLFPPPPGALPPTALNIEYVSMLAEAQKASQTVAIERFLGTVGNVGAAHPEIFDTVDFDVTMMEYADDINVPPAVVRSPEAVAAIRAKRSAQEQAAAEAQNSLAAAQGAKTLSQTPVGDGRSALQAVMGQ